MKFGGALRLLTIPVASGVSLVSDSPSAIRRGRVAAPAPD
jgi:hypothetical protein